MSETFREPPGRGQLSGIGAAVTHSIDGVSFPPNVFNGRMLPSVADPDSEPVRTGVWVGLAAIIMMFAAFTSAAVVRKSSADDWQHIVLPHIVYLNTAALLLSSATLEIARRRIRAYAHREVSSSKIPLGWLSLTCLLGVIFVMGQLVAWSQLRAQGVYLASSPTSSFWYVMTAFHGVHVLGGLGGLIRLIPRVTVFSLHRGTLDATAYYWHFMGVLWMYLLLLIWLKF